MPTVLDTWMGPCLRRDDLFKSECVINASKSSTQPFTDALYLSRAMTKVNIEEAKERLPELLDEVDKGEEVIIAKGDGVAYKITAVALESAKPTQRVAGLGKGKTVLYMSDDFDEEDPEINAMFYGE